MYAENFDAYPAYWLCKSSVFAGLRKAHTPVEDVRDSPNPCAIAETNPMATTFNLYRERPRAAYLSLKNIEQSLTHRQETEAAAGKKNSSNKRLLTERGECAYL